MCKKGNLPAEELPQVEVLHPLYGLQGVSHGLLIQPRHLLKLVGVSAQRDELQQQGSQTREGRGLVLVI